ncbi:hypothetical protein J6590_050201 [Homalodisca vitripennis]|nr:hypothetical protein J6590_050201 [Homalodisca vitripennis]
MVKSTLVLLVLVVGIAYGALGYIDMGMATHHEISSLIQEMQKLGSGENLGLGPVGGVDDVSTDGEAPGRSGGVGGRPLKEEVGGRIL